jgi:hypothetical protein
MKRAKTHLSKLVSSNSLAVDNLGKAVARSSHRLMDLAEDLSSRK